MEASRLLHDAVQDADFERFYRSYANHVYRYTLAVLRNPADAEDVTQTTFLNAYRAMRQGERPRKPHNWLIKIAHNVCRSRYLRLARRPQEVPLDETVAELAVPPEERPNVRAVLDALGTLPFNQRAALVMRELEGRSYAEIASTLDVSVPAVEMLIFRARKTMRTRASSLSALGAVQLPASLASWLESGGVVAGGSAIVGTGLAVKAAVALTAAAVIAGGVKATALDSGTAGGQAPVAVVVSSTGQSATARTSAGVSRQKQLARRRHRSTRQGVLPGAPTSATSSAHESATSGSSSTPSQTATDTVGQAVSSVTSTPSVPSVSPPAVDVPLTLPPTPELPPPPPLPPPPKLP